MNKSMWNNEAVKAYESGQGVVLVEKPYLHYEPIETKVEPTLSQKLRDAGYTRRTKGWDKEMNDEPVAWGMEQPDGDILDVISPEEHARLEGGYTIPLYRQRTWVGLTDEEITQIIETGLNIRDSIESALDKLKEKNT
jgi:hypothetical protein